MKYFIDTEFIEGFHKPLFGKKRHFIDLISIGIVCEYGREYYAISNEFREKDADEWVKYNVISKLSPKYRESLITDTLGEPVYLNIWKSNKQIASEIEDFILPPYGTCDGGRDCCVMYGPTEADLNSDTFHHKLTLKNSEPNEFYAYFADYDWVVFCSLFGRMINLPESFPMYCNDLKQTIDEKAYGMIVNKKRMTFEGALQEIKDNPNYPKQINEYNALSDAKWNYELYKFLKTI